MAGCNVLNAPRENLARITRIAVTTQVASVDVVNGVTMRAIGLGEIVELHQVIRDLIEEDLQMIVGNIELVPEAGLEGFYWHGATWKGLDQTTSELSGHAIHRR